VSPSQRTLFPRGASKKWTNAREPARSVAQVEKLRGGEDHTSQRRNNSYITGLPRKIRVRKRNNVDQYDSAPIQGFI
jgi:hypothetical protein